MTARPSGAVASAPSPMARAIGTMPAIIAALVISTGRIRARAASIATTKGDRAYQCAQRLRAIYHQDNQRAARRIAEQLVVRDSSLVRIW